MIFYKVQGEKIVTPRVNRDQLEVGQTYNMNSLISRGKFYEEYQAYFSEYNFPYEESLVMTNSRGEKAFAVATNDCARDQFPDFTLAKVLVKEGNYIVYGYCNGRNDTETNIVIMQVVDVFPAVSAFGDGEAIDVKVVKRLKVDKKLRFTDLMEVGIHQEAVKHVLMVLENNFGDFLTPKYCFNPGRVITNRLFERDEENEFVSYMQDGLKIMLNQHSHVRYRESKSSEVINDVFLRCFFSKKHKDKDMVFVDGEALIMLRENELDAYMQDSNLTPNVARTILKKVITHKGSHFYAVTNVKLEIRPIYKTCRGFATFALNDYELDFIKEVQEIAI